MCSFRSVLLLVAAVFPSASAQSVCQTGWTQAQPSNETWTSKCYRTFGPMAGAENSVPLMPGYNHSGCKSKCSAESVTARMLCLASEAENVFVSKKTYMKGWVGFTQNTSSSDYEEPAGGWGWECGSTYVPTWTPAALGDQAEPNDRGESGVDVSCAALSRDSTVHDRSCGEGGVETFWDHSALLGPLSRCRAQALTNHPLLLRRTLHL